MKTNLNINILLGKTIHTIERNRHNDDELTFYTTDGKKYIMGHDQECCESLHIEDLAGDLNDLLDSPIIQAEESSNEDNPPANHDDCFLWTFYRLATAKGQVVIRWLGESNGYYGVGVDFVEVDISTQKYL
jgi:hypothetical protein